MQMGNGRWSVVPFPPPMKFGTPFSDAERCGIRDLWLSFSPFLFFYGMKMEVTREHEILRFSSSLSPPRRSRGQMERFGDVIFPFPFLPPPLTMQQQGVSTADYSVLPFFSPCEEFQVPRGSACLRRVCRTTTRTPPFSFFLFPVLIVISERAKQRPLSFLSRPLPSRGTSIS